MDLPKIHKGHVLMGDLPFQVLLAHGLDAAAAIQISREFRDGVLEWCRAIKLDKASAASVRLLDRHYRSGHGMQKLLIEFRFKELADNFGSTRRAGRPLITAAHEAFTAGQPWTGLQHLEVSRASFTIHDMALFPQAFSSLTHLRLYSVFIEAAAPATAPIQNHPGASPSSSPPVASVDEESADLPHTTYTTVTPSSAASQRMEAASLSSIQAISQIPGLRSLELHDCNLELGVLGSLSDLSLLTQLTRLSIGDKVRPVDEPLPDISIPAICNLTNLRSLEVKLGHGSSADQTPICSISAALTQLTRLELHNAVLTPQGFSAALSMPDLRTLAVYSITDLTQPMDCPDGPTIDLSMYRYRSIDLAMLAHLPLHRLQKPVPGSNLSISSDVLEDPLELDRLIRDLVASLARAGGGEGVLSCEQLWLYRMEHLDVSIPILGVMQHHSCKEFFIRVHGASLEDLPALANAAPHIRNLTILNGEVTDCTVKAEDLTPASPEAAAAAQALVGADLGPSFFHDLAMLPSLGFLNLLHDFGEDTREHITALTALACSLTSLHMSSKQASAMHAWDQVKVSTVCALTKLERLSIFFGNGEDHPVPIPLGSIAERGEDEVITLARALPTLKQLDLSSHTIHQAGLDAVLQHLTRLTELELRDIRDITESRAGAACSWKKLSLLSAQPPQVQMLARIPLKGVQLEVTHRGHVGPDAADPSVSDTLLSDMARNLSTAASVSFDMPLYYRYHFPRPVVLVSQPSQQDCLRMLSQPDLREQVGVESACVGLHTEVVSSEVVSALAAAAPSLSHLVLQGCGVVEPSVWRALSQRRLPQLAFLEVIRHGH